MSNFQTGHPVTRPIQQQNNEGIHFRPEEILDALPSYVLGILDPEEMIAVDDYIRLHPELQAQVGQLEITTAQLSYATPDMPMAPDAISRAVARAQNDISHQSSSTSIEPRQIANQIVPPTHHRKPNLYDQPYIQPQRVTGWLASIEQWFSLHMDWKAPAMAATAIMFVCAFIALQSISGMNALRRELDISQQYTQQIEIENAALRDSANQVSVDLQAELDATRQYVQQLTLENNQLQQTIDTVLVSPNYIVSLTGENLDGSFYASQDTGLLILRGLQTLPSDQTYQLWVIPPDSEPIPSGLVGQVQNGVTLWSDVIPALNDTTFTIAVSIEPTGGSPAPTGPVIISGTRT